VGEKKTWPESGLRGGVGRRGLMTRGGGGSMYCGVKI